MEAVLVICAMILFGSIPIILVWIGNKIMDSFFGGKTTISSIKPGLLGRGTVIKTQTRYDAENYKLDIEGLKQITFDFADIYRKGNIADFEFESFLNSLISIREQVERCYVDGYLLKLKQKKDLRRLDKLILQVKGLRLEDKF